jgi:hypothetical protein
VGERLRGRQGYVETASGEYMLSVVDRGADLLRSRGQIDDDTATCLACAFRCTFVTQSREV